jgi:hypothetical protein
MYVNVIIDPALGFLLIGQHGVGMLHLCVITIEPPCKSQGIISSPASPDFFKLIFYSFLAIPVPAP